VPETPGFRIEKPGRWRGENLLKYFRPEPAADLADVIEITHHHHLRSDSFRGRGSTVVPPEQAVQARRCHVEILPAFQRLGKAIFPADATGVL
jgi:hypothetical protein